MQQPVRCPWCGDDPLYQAYHDEEWGKPCHDESRLFELLLLEGAQAGLSWITVLRKRENYREALDGFDPEKIARYGEADLARLMNNPGVIRNRLKLQSAVTNAQAYLRLQDEMGGLDPYLWALVAGQPIVNRWRSMKEVPASTALSDALSKDLSRRGFKFVGSTICYAYMQAIGMVDDHLLDCHCHSAL